MTYLKPTVGSVLVDGDPRPGMIGLVALLAAALYYAWFRGLLGRQWLLAFAALLIVIEQGNEVGWGWPHFRDTNHMALVNALYDTRDLAVYLRSVPGEKRLEINDKDVHFSFGDWYRIPAGHAMTASMLTATSELGGWWDDRLLPHVRHELRRQPRPHPRRPAGNVHRQERHQNLAHGGHVSARLDGAPDGSAPRRRRGRRQGPRSPRSICARRPSR